MQRIFNKNYFIDIDNISNVCRIETKKSEKKIDEKDDSDDFTINIFKYETIKLCIDRLLNEYEDEDQELFPTKNTNISFWVAFNTLIKYKILIEDDEQEF